MGAAALSEVEPPIVQMRGEQLSLRANAPISRSDASPLLRVVGFVGVAVLLGALLGVALVEARNPLYVVGAFLGIAALLVIARSTEVGLFSLVAVITLLPFAVVPVPLGTFKLTALDVTLVLLLLVWIARILVARDESLRVSGVEPYIVVFVALCVFSFLIGTGTTSETMRLFLKMINSVLLFFTVVNCVRTRAEAGRLYSALLLGGGVGAAIGLTLYFLPTPIATRLLTALGPLGYPSGGQVVKYIAYTDTQRAIGTAIDPNIFGAMLMVIAVLVTSQVLAARPILDRRLLIVIAGVVGAALLLTYSRGSWIGALAGVLLMATFRYRRVWLVVALGAAMLALGVLPDQGGYMSHLQSGFAAKDQAAAMRLGEYKDAFRLISQYPFFGVGFGVAPDIDLYIGVSSIYLLLAEQIGLVGLSSYLLVVGIVIWRGLAPLIRGQVAPEVEPLLLGVVGALVAAMTAGVFDHHFVNLRFPHVVALFWLLAGLAVVLARLGRGKAADATPTRGSPRA